MDDVTSIAPAPLPPAPAPGEGREKRGDDQYREPDLRYATPDWRREMTTEIDPRKGR